MISEKKVKILKAWAINEALNIEGDFISEAKKELKGKGDNEVFAFLTGNIEGLDDLSWHVGYLTALKEVLGGI